MIQSIMLVALGFLIATLCALLLAPSFWRRAERLTTRRLERTMPMSIADTEADRDQLRASYAIIIRRLEAALSQEKMRSARQLVKISRLEMQIAQLNEKATQLRGQLDAEHNAASVLRRTLATRVPELRDAAHGARQLVHVRDHEIRSIVNRLRQREEALAVAQRTTDMQQAEIARLRQAMEMSGAQNAGRFKLRPTQWSIHDYRAEYDRLNVELSKLRERLSVAYDREANQVKQLRTELQQLADQIVTAASSLPERESPRAIPAPTTEDEEAGAGVEAAPELASARSIDAILSGETDAQTRLPALRNTALAEPSYQPRRGGLMSSALSPKRLARNAAATLAGLAGAKPRHSEAKSQSEPGGSPEPPQPPTRLAKPSGRLSAAELLGGGAQSERNTPFDDASRASEAPPSGQGEDPTPTATGDAGPAEAGPPDPQPPETAAPQPAKSEAAAQTAQDDPAPEQEEGPAISGNLYDTLRTAKPNAEGQAQHRRSDASELRNEEAGAEAKSAADETPETPDAQDNEDADAVSAADDDVEDERAADDGEPYSETEKGEASQAEAADKPTTGNGRDHGEDGEDADSSSSLLDRLKQVPENQTR